MNLFGESFQQGDIIYSLNNQPINGLRSLKKAVGDVSYGAPAVLQVERNGALRYLVVELE